MHDKIEITQNIFFEAVERALPENMAIYLKQWCIDELYQAYKDVPKFTRFKPLKFRERLAMAFEIYAIRESDLNTFYESEDLADLIAENIENIDLENWALDVIKNNRV